jgi:hypothetical protein
VWRCISLVQVMHHNISSPSKSIRRTLLHHIMRYIISLSHVYWVEMTSHSRDCCSAEHNGTRQMSILKVYSSKFRALLLAIFGLNLLIIKESILFLVYTCTRQILIRYFVLTFKDQAQTALFKGPVRTAL